MKIIAIDPGPKESGVCVLSWPANELPSVDWKRQLPNDHAIDLIRERKLPVAIEDIQSYAERVGSDVFMTVKMIGRVIEVCRFGGYPLTQIKRPTVKAVLTGRSVGGDPAVRRAVISRFADWYGLTEKEVKGVKAHPGPLYNVSNHIWSAIAVGIAYFELEARRAA